MTPINPGRGKVLLGMSGGVDSSVASFLLQREGWEVTGLSLLTCDAGKPGLEDAEAVCRSLGIPWQMTDVRTEFRNTVIRDFIAGYLQGRTPNPCILCNPTIKFAVLAREADRLGCQAIATGHYARITRVPDSGRLALARTDAGLKDQTYFLYRLSQAQLGRMIFPLAGLDKPAVRRIAAEQQLAGRHGQPVAAKPDSQDNCFVPDGDYASYIRAELAAQGDETGLRLTEPGPVVNMSGEQVGTHKGLIHYTLGQRKGFQVQTIERLFVVGKNPAANSLTVGSYAQVLRRTILVVDPVYSGLAAIAPGERLMAKIRNSAREVPCRVDPLADGSLLVTFDQPAAAPAAGQSCVFYRDGLIMAGGFIADSE